MAYEKDCMEAQNIEDMTVPKCWGRFFDVTNFIIIECNKGEKSMSEKDFLAKMEEIMDLDEDTLTMDSLLDDIDEWDSLSVLSLTVYAKKTLGIDLETSVIISFKTINDIYIKCFGGD